MKKKSIQMHIIGSNRGEYNELLCDIDAENPNIKANYETEDS